MDNETEQTELLAPELMLDDGEDSQSPVIRLDQFADPTILTHTMAAPPQPDIRRLVVIHGEDGPIRHPLHKPEMTIGRSRHADIELHGRYISRVHALIRIREDASAVIEDIGSKNGLLVNGEYRDCHTLADGDSVLIGQIELEYREIQPRDAV
jgi:pSer/pThr/pTyr-binding forkhead associated (FHA) protein